MGFELRKFVNLRATVYHVTDPENVPRLRKVKRIDTAASLMQMAGRHDLLRRKREEPTKLTVDGDIVLLNDQIPLILANVDLGNAWNAEDFISFLNQHVYFWPDKVKNGVRFRDHYAKKAILRIATRELLRANLNQSPLFSSFNAGALRKQNGHRVQRGPDMFLSAEQFPRTPGQVKEVVFAFSVNLPIETELTVGGNEWVSI